MNILDVGVEIIHAAKLGLKGMIMRYAPFNEINELMEYFDEGYETSQDEAYRRFSEVRVIPPDDMPADPFSREYADRVMEIYKVVSNKEHYSVSNEVAGFDIDEFTIRPFPFFTGSVKLTAQHYSLIGKLLGMMDVKPGDTILECGVGFGNTTLALAMLGCNVTALDIADAYCEVIRRRAKLNQVDIKVVQSDYMWAETTEDKYNAVVFFESFHHCWEFERLLISLHRIILPGGKIYFGGEPINTEFPMPWGVRLDGEALFVVRRNGWMELGFHQDFFEELLLRTGWRGTCVDAHFWFAARKYDPIIISPAEGRMLFNCGTIKNSVLHIDVPEGTDPTHVVFGPYLQLSKGKYRFDFLLDADIRPAQTMIIDVCHSKGAHVVYLQELLPSDLLEGRISGEFTLDGKVGEVEVRLVASGGFQVGIRQLSIQPMDETAP